MAKSKSKVPGNYIPIHEDNIAGKDWLIVLEAGTIVGPSSERLRVARTTQERKIVTKRGLFRAPEHFLVVEGYDPRIHALYFCPQLYKYDADRRLLPLQGEEIGRLIANTLESGIRDRRPWYEPADKRPDEPIINAPAQTDFDSLVVEMPAAREDAA